MQRPAMQQPGLIGYWGAHCFTRPRQGLSTAPKRLTRVQTRPAASMRAAVILALAALSSPTAVGSNSGSGSISGSNSGSGSGGAAGSGWDPAALHLFVDHEGLAEVSGLELVEHRPFKTYDMAVEPSEPWDGGMCPPPHTLPSFSPRTHSPHCLRCCTQEDQRTGSSRATLPWSRSPRA